MMAVLRRVGRRLYWVIGIQFGLDFRKAFHAMKSFPRYLSDLSQFKKNYSGQLGYLPCLHDYQGSAGDVASEYFLQDLYVAQAIKRKNPQLHVDVGSRIDGFVAHVASFREVEVFDVRPMNSMRNITFKQLDFMDSEAVPVAYCDSLSCLHALEHFGLGRYGDPLRIDGSVRGLTNLAKMLKPGGILYLSVPIGIERVEFNGHRILDPLSVVEIASDSGCDLRRLVFVQDGELREQHDMAKALRKARSDYYTLSMFIFIKRS